MPENENEVTASTNEAVNDSVSSASTQEETNSDNAPETTGSQEVANAPPVPETNPEEPAATPTKTLEEIEAEIAETEHRIGNALNNPALQNDSEAAERTKTFNELLEQLNRNMAEHHTLYQSIDNTNNAAVLASNKTAKAINDRVTKLNMLSAKIAATRSDSAPKLPEVKPYDPQTYVAPAPVAKTPVDPAVREQEVNDLIKECEVHGRTVGSPSFKFTNPHNGKTIHDAFGVQATAIKKHQELKKELASKDKNDADYDALQKQTKDLQDSINNLNAQINGNKSNKNFKVKEYDPDNYKPNKGMELDLEQKDRLNFEALLKSFGKEAFESPYKSIMGEMFYQAGFMVHDLAAVGVLQRLFIYPAAAVINTAVGVTLIGASVVPGLAYAATGGKATYMGKLAGATFGMGLDYTGYNDKHFALTTALKGMTGIPIPVSEIGRRHLAVITALERLAGIEDKNNFDFYARNFGEFTPGETNTITDKEVKESVADANDNTPSKKNANDDEVRLSKTASPEPTVKVTTAPEAPNLDVDVNVVTSPGNTTPRAAESSVEVMTAPKRPEVNENIAANQISPEFIKASSPRIRNINGSGGVRATVRQDPNAMSTRLPNQQAGKFDFFTQAARGLTNRLVGSAQRVDAEYNAARAGQNTKENSSPRTKRSNSL